MTAYKNFEKKSESIIEKYDFEKFSFTDYQGTKDKTSITLLQEIAKDHSGFQIEDRVKKLSGYQSLKEQEQRDLVSQLVAKEIAELKQKAQEEGFSAGFAKGLADAEEDAQKIREEGAHSIGVFLEEIQQASEHYREQCQEKMISLVKMVSKWILLREPSYEKYLPNILEKLITEINSTQNLIIRFDKKSFSSKDEIVKVLEDKLGTLKNLRIESDTNLKNGGVILESEHAIYDSTLDKQLELIDQIFDSVK